MRRLLAFPTLLIALAAPVRAADAIDLSVGWGNKDGCINRVHQDAYSEIMLLLTDKVFVTAVNTCEIEKLVTNEDGSLTLFTTCQTEGWDSIGPMQFTVAHSKTNEAALVITGEDGNAYRELSRCD